MASTQHQTQAARETGADSGVVGDLHAVACRAELRSAADALGTRAVRMLGEATPRASRSRPSAPARGIPRRHGGHCAREKNRLRTGHRVMQSSGVRSRRQRRRACRMGSKVSRYPQAISGALRALQRGKSVLIGLKRGQTRRIQAYRPGPRWARLGEDQAATGCRPSCRRPILPRKRRAGVASKRKTEPAPGALMPAD